MAVWLIRMLYEEPSDAGNTFYDVDDWEWWAGQVVRLGEVGVTSGCSADPPYFCPDYAVTRAQMATFLTRAFRLDPVASSGFADVDLTMHTLTASVRWPLRVSLPDVGLILPGSVPTRP